MATLVLKKKTTRVASPVEGVSVLAQMIDAAGAASEQIAALKATIKSASEKLKAVSKPIDELQAYIDQMPLDADKTLVELGSKYMVTAGVKAKARSITDLALVRTLLGEETFMALATVKLGDLDKYLTPVQLDKVLKIDRTTRSLKLTRRPS
jgi:hypothetical protein